MYENDELQNVPETDIPKLLEALKPHFPMSIHAYYYIDSLVKWKKKVPSLNSGILAPNGDFRHGVFFYVCFMNSNFPCSAYVWDKDDSETFKNALIATKRIKWKDPDYFFLFTCMTPDVWCVLESVLTKIFGDRKYNTSIDKVFWLPVEEVLKFDIKVPEGMELGPLQKEHAGQIDSVWPHRCEGSKELIEMMTWVNFGNGLFRKENKKLVSWAFYWFFGALGVVQTDISERRKGYGKVVVQSVCKEMGKRGLDVHLNIVNGNTVSEAFFRSQGFKHAFDSVWVSFLRLSKK